MDDPFSDMISSEGTCVNQNPITQIRNRIKPNILTISIKYVSPFYNTKGDQQILVLNKTFG